MKAQDNITYVVISANIVSQIFTKEDMSEWNEDNIHVLELSDYEKQWVEIGMQYDEATNSIVQPSLQEYKTKRIEFINTMFELESQSLKAGVFKNRRQGLIISAKIHKTAQCLIHYHKLGALNLKPLF